MKPEVVKGTSIPGTGSFQMASIERDSYGEYVAKRKAEYLNSIEKSAKRDYFSHPHKEPVRIVRPVELKGVDVHPSSTRVPSVDDMSTTVGVRLLNGINEGTASYQRIGRNVWMESVRVRGWIHFTFESGTNIFPYVRFVIVYDRTPSGVQPPFNEVFQITTAAGVDSTPHLFTPIAFESTKRFRVLADWEVQSRPFNTVATVPVDGYCSDYIPFDKYIPLKNLEV